MIMLYMSMHKLSKTKNLFTVWCVESVLLLRFENIFSFIIINVNAIYRSVMR